MTTTIASQNIKHVFVLMLENRSLDHMLGFSGITGTDADTGKNTKVSPTDRAEGTTEVANIIAVKAKESLFISSSGDQISSALQYGRLFQQSSFLKSLDAEL